MTNKEQARKEVTSLFAERIAEAQSLAQFTPLAWMVVDQTMSFQPICHRENGYGLIGGKLATFSFRSAALRMMERMAKSCKDANVSVNLTVMTVSEWAEKRTVAINKMIEDLA